MNYADYYSGQGGSGQSGGMFAPGYEGPYNDDIGNYPTQSYTAPTRPSQMYPNQMRIPGQYQPQMQQMPQRFNRPRYGMPHQAPPNPWKYNWNVGPGQQMPGYPGMGGGGYALRQRYGKLGQRNVKYQAPPGRYQVRGSYGGYQDPYAYR